MPTGGVCELVRDIGGLIGVIVAMYVDDSAWSRQMDSQDMSRQSHLFSPLVRHVSSRSSTSFQNVKSLLTDCLDWRTSSSIHHTDLPARLPQTCSLWCTNPLGDIRIMKEACTTWVGSEISITPRNWTKTHAISGSQNSEQPQLSTSAVGHLLPTSFPPTGTRAILVPQNSEPQPSTSTVGNLQPTSPLLIGQTRRRFFHSPNA